MAKRAVKAYNRRPSPRTVKLSEELKVKSVVAMTAIFQLSTFNKRGCADKNLVIKGEYDAYTVVSGAYGQNA